MSTTLDTATKIPTSHPEHKRTPSEKTRRIVLDMIDQEVNQSITDRSMERRRNGNATPDLEDE